MPEEKPQYKIDLIINDKNISMNSFVQSFFINSLLGSFKSLRDIPESIQDVTIKIEKK